MRKEFKSLNIRGMLYIWILLLLRKKSMSGYEVMKKINELTLKTWRPTTGSVYPALKKLERKGYIAIKGTGERKKKIYSITEEGKKKLTQLRKNMLEAAKSSKIRNVINCFLWPEEPDEVREEFEKLFVSLVDLREKLKKDYNHQKIQSVKRVISKFRKMIDRLKNEVE
ncbi:MAG: PadR family transcriptional regulator [Candidatus Aenigmarchaeota archaeon]|nr:PadR family transcriptional regulator [Candidatus Aenigmarchaeota archaeon]